MKLIPLPAFADNYIWLLHDAHQALVVDPGDAPTVQAALQQRGLQLEAILVTHHHADHYGDAQGLRERPQLTLPCALLIEPQINPFLRTRQAAVIKAAQAVDASSTDEVSTFAALRRWKNEFQ